MLRSLFGEAKFCALSSGWYHWLGPRLGRISGCALWMGGANSWALHSPLGQDAGCDPKQGGATGWPLRFGRAMGLASWSPLARSSIIRL